MTEIDTAVINGVQYKAGQPLISSAYRSGKDIVKPRWVELPNHPSYKRLDLAFNAGIEVPIVYMFKGEIVQAQLGTIRNMDLHRIGDKLLSLVVYSVSPPKTEHPDGSLGSERERLRAALGKFRERMGMAIKDEICRIFGIRREFERDSYYG